MLAQLDKLVSRFFTVPYLHACTHARRLCLPETPRWLLKNRSEKAAKDALTRLFSAHPDIVKQELRLLQISATKESKIGEGTWSDVFTGDMRRRLLIGWGTQFHQQLTGINVIMIYAVNIFASIGIPKFKGMIAIGVVNVLSTLVVSSKGWLQSVV